MKSTIVRRFSLLALGSVLALGLLPATQAAGTEIRQPLAAEAKPLPFSTAFEKGEPGENGGPYVLVLTNTAAEALKVQGSIIWSVASHNRANTIKLPERVIEPGGTWKIADLAVEDRVVLTAEGYATLDVKVPPGGKK